MNINNFINNDTFLQDYYAFTASPYRPVEVRWAGTGIHTITGPNPLMDISTSFNSTEGGILESVVHTITLTGKIFKPAGPNYNDPTGSGVGGFINMISGIKQLEQFFKGCPVATLEVFCTAGGGSNTSIYSASGVKVKGITFNKTTDNWAQSVDYSVDLEHKISADKDESVEERSESWTIEPMDEAIYTKFSRNVALRSENINPKMLPAAPNQNSPQPATAVGGGQFGGGALQIFNMPQYRISRRLSAKGVVPPPSSVALCPPTGEIKQIQNIAFLSAKKWVEKRAGMAFNGSAATGCIVLKDNPGIYTQSLTGLWLYNHSRTVSADTFNGTYETNDTWIGMPTGIPYTETFSVDYSTDDTGGVTIRVNGNIQGLQLVPEYVTASNSGSLFSEPTPISPNGPGGNIHVDLSFTTKDAPSPGLIYNVPSLAVGTVSPNTTMQSAKYLNALNGWINDIKPYVYRRACLAINSEERQVPPPPRPNQTNPPPPQSNFIYLKENLLNVIPNSTSEGHDPIKGTISYSHEFNNKLHVISGVFSENIRITNTAPATNVQETQILGRALGPLLYSAGVTNPRKSISVDIVVPKPTGIKNILQTEETCPLYVSGYFWKTVDTLIQGVAPFANRTTAFFENAKSQQQGTFFKDSDSEDWSPTDGRYSRTVSWIYQQCTADKFYLDH